MYILQNNERCVHIKKLHKHGLFTAGMGKDRTSYWGETTNSIIHWFMIYVAVRLAMSGGLKVPHTCIEKSLCDSLRVIWLHSIVCIRVFKTSIPNWWGEPYWKHHVSQWEGQCKQRYVCLHPHTVPPTACRFRKREGKLLNVFPFLHSLMPIHTISMCIQYKPILSMGLVHTTCVCATYRIDARKKSDSMLQ